MLTKENSMIDFILNFFKKKEKIKKSTAKVVFLDKWNRLKKLPNAYIYDILRKASLEEISISLAHSDQYMIERFLDCSKFFHKEENLKILLEQSNVSKIESDKMKAYLANLSGLDQPGYIQYEPYDLL
jgi:hypothetical protein